MLNISTIAKQEKNKLHTDSTSLILLDIIPNVADSETIRICYNNEDITYLGNLYQAFPFTITDSGTDTTGSEPSVDLKVDNTSRALQPYVEQYNGGNGFTVRLRAVNTKALEAGETAPEVDERFTVNHAVVTQEAVTFNLGSGYSLNTRRPLYRYMKNNCPFFYKGTECGATSKLATCNHTLIDCRARGNSSRFGGFLGIDQKGVYLNG